jgi:hypothetical protein
MPTLLKGGKPGDVVPQFFVGAIHAGIDNFEAANRP